MEIKGFRVAESTAPRPGDAARVPVLVVRDVGDLSPFGFDLRGTLESGQCFRWRRLPDDAPRLSAASAGPRYAGVVRGRAVAASLSAGGRDLVLENGTAEDFADVLLPYFDLERDYRPILQAVAKDPFMEAALRYGGGARLLVQEFDETLLSYLLSAQNNIPRIMGLVESLSAAYGRVLTGTAWLSSPGRAAAPDGSLFAFPTPDALAAAAARCRGRLADCRPDALCAGAFAGYRCPYLMRTAQRLLEGGAVPSPDALRRLPAAEARAALRVLPGVGAKVADCTLLSSGLHTEVCPVDRWVERVVRTVYLGGDAKADAKKDTTDEVRRFVEGYFGAEAGFAQLWFFLYARSGDGLSAVGTGGAGG